MSDWPTPMDSPAWQAWRIAWDWITERTLRGLSLDVQQDILYAPDVQAVHDYMSRLAHWSDGDKVQAAAQVWLAMVKHEMRTAQSKEAA